jgi:3-oxoacyl-[acyl-carrier-protein] synthase-1
MMSGKVFITGIGIISAIGDNVQENITSLRQQKTGLGTISILDTKHKNEFVAGEIKYRNPELASLLGLPPGSDFPRTSLLGMIAASEAFHHAGVQNYPALRTGLIAGTTVGGMDKTERYYYHLDQNTDFIKSHSCGSITDQIAHYLNTTYFVSTLNTACSSSANAIMYGTRLLQNGYLDRVIAGGFDSLSVFTINGFKSLFILSQESCKPFDKNRKGLNLGEGAGFLVLESADTIQKTGNEALGILSGYANTNDAFHQTASSEDGEGAFQCIRKALEKANLPPSDIDYINLHGTGTENNDLSEGKALLRVFDKNIPPFSSTKSYTGHTLGAAGGVEAVFSVLSIRENTIYPNLFFEQPIDELGISPVTELKEGCDIRHVMSNSFGFGGNDTTLIFSKV